MNRNDLKNLELVITTEKAKYALEDLYLYLNEIDKIIKKTHVSEAEKEENKYKLQQLEKYITEMNEIFNNLAKNIINENKTLM